jgi:UDP-glucuronate 4-epimerase
MKILITGTAGFIGFHLAKLLLSSGLEVHGFDGMTDYYDVSLKKTRHKILEQFVEFSSTLAMLEDKEAVDKCFSNFNPDIVIHLAAQAGVRYSLENPRAYIDSNVVGTFNIMDAAKHNSVKHLMIASTSSVYGANECMPFSEREKADTQLTIYAATKKAAESMAHSYSHIHGIPVTIFRFFTVYGPWGRPDMALFKFTKNMLENQPIDIYNNGEMQRDFTYVDDLVSAIKLLVQIIPEVGKPINETDSLSPVAPFRIVNIGNSTSVNLMDFIEAIEIELGIKAIRNYMPMQTGDVPATWADATLLESLSGYQPETDYRSGVASFVNWYREFYNA